MTISPGEQRKGEAERTSALRPWLLGLALLAVAATAERVVGLSAPMPTMEAPASLRLAGYRVSALEGEPARQGRELSHGQLRRFRLEPRAGGSPLVVSLVPVRSRTGTELSEGSKERKGLNLVAVAEQVPSFALSDRRLLSLPRPNGLGAAPKPDQIALGRGPKDPAGTITRLQSCFTPSGHARVSASTLVGEERRAKESRPSAALRWLLRLAGITPARHECLAVQVASETPGKAPLLAAWQDVQGVLRVP
ncbi:MAG: hypothetical protein ACKO8I_09265 [Cyanobacteriota bacterium]